MICFDLCDTMQSYNSKLHVGYVYTIVVQDSAMSLTIYIEYNLLVVCVNIRNLLVDISPLLWDKSVCVTPLVQESG